MIAFPKLTEQELLDRIRIPSEGKLNIFLDTDTYNEIDDQFAILYAMLSPERLCLKGISAALFFNDRSASPADGMEKSYREILKIMDFLGKDPEGFVFRGCTEPLADEEVPRESLACDAIIAPVCRRDRRLHQHCKRDFKSSGDYPPDYGGMAGGEHL